MKRKVISVFLVLVLALTTTVLGQQISNELNKDYYLSEEEHKESCDCQKCFNMNSFIDDIRSISGIITIGSVTVDLNVRDEVMKFIHEYGFNQCEPYLVYTTIYEFKYLQQRAAELLVEIVVQSMEFDINDVYEQKLSYDESLIVPFSSGCSGCGGALRISYNHVRVWTRGGGLYVDGVRVGTFHMCTSYNVSRIGQCARCGSQILSQWSTTGCGFLTWW